MIQVVTLPGLLSWLCVFYLTRLAMNADLEQSPWVPTVQPVIRMSVMAKLPYSTLNFKLNFKLRSSSGCKTW